MSSPARARNPRGEGGRLRADIVQAAAGILDETGDEQAVTLRAVARRVGIAAPSIYTHFPDVEAILLAVVTDEFGELDRRLALAADTHRTDGDTSTAEARLRTVCGAYLDYARERPQRYRLLFGGLWDSAKALESGAITAAQAEDLGRETLRLLVAGIEGCVDVGRSTSTDVWADAVALWLGLHGLAHQRTAAPTFRWPPDIADRVITALAHLTTEPA